MIDLAQRLADAEQIAAACCEVALGHFRHEGSRAVDIKGPRDFVSEADRAVERAARDLLARRYPDEILVGEESGGDANLVGADVDHWILDPIDGTTNFLNGLPLWAVSLAFVRDGAPLLGVIVLPALGETIAAARSLGMRGTGAVRNRSDAARHALVGIGRNNRWDATDRFHLEEDLEARGISTVCLGSCATSLAMVATGRLSAYVERSVKRWDVAAGAVLCNEAGLFVAIEEADGCVDVVAGQNDILRSSDRFGPCRARWAGGAALKLGMA